MNSIRPLDALRRFWWIVVIFTILGAIVAGAPSPQKAADSVTRWNAAHTLLVSNTSDGGVYSDPQAFNQLTLFATTGRVPERAAEALDYGGSPAALARQVVVTSDQQTGALEISTTQETEADAVAIADAFAEELTTYLSERQDQLSQDRIAATLGRLNELEAQINDVEATVLMSSPDPDGVPIEDPVARAQLDALSRQYSVVFEQYNTLQADQGQLVLTTLEEAQGVPVQETGPQRAHARGCPEASWAHSSAVPSVSVLRSCSPVPTGGSAPPTSSPRSSAWRSTRRFLRCGITSPTSSQSAPVSTGRCRTRTAPCAA